MKKRLLKLMTLTLLLIAASVSGLVSGKTAKADETIVLNQIVVTQNPTKTTYAKGESLDLTGMVVTGYYSDGTTGVLTDYQVTGYDSSIYGTQTVFVVCQNLIATFNINVVPARITNVAVSNRSTTSLTLTWDAMPGASSYEIYELDEMTGSYNMVNTAYTNSATFYYQPGTIHTYQICAVEFVNGVTSRSEYSEPFTAATSPEAVTGLYVTQTTATTVTLSWNAAAGATGYLIYRAPAASADFTYCGYILTNTYTDQNLASGTSYVYKVCAYTSDISFTGDYSQNVYTSTTPAKVKLKYKAGEEKIRFSWTKVTGADSYDIYISNDGIDYRLLATNKGNTNCSYLVEELTTGDTYYFNAIARRSYKGTAYDSLISDPAEITMQETEPTSMVGKFFADKEAFTQSWSYTKIPAFAKAVDYSKSVVIPGLITTNVGGFSSTAMCPQGITFANGYLLMTAYDMNTEENSVIYVMDKSKKKLLTTLILPSKTHAGGLGFDGVNLWIPTGTKISSVSIDVVDDAVASGDPYAWIEYNTTVSLGITASYLTFYDDKLWIGTYNELQATNMYSYIIQDIDTEPYLEKADTIVMPTRVQGAAFTDAGTLILSRSCQLYKGLRGYIRQLEVYRPAFSKAVDGVIPLGDVGNIVSMPSMNEDIAISGSYLYVNFESGAFAKSSYKMDRICAFKLTSITKKAKK